MNAISPFFPGAVAFAVLTRAPIPTAANTPRSTRLAPSVGLLFIVPPLELACLLDARRRRVPAKRGGQQINLSARTSFPLGRLEAGHNAGRERDCEHAGVRPTVLIVDDHADFRASARALLEAEGFDVVGEAAGGEEAIGEVDRLRPDVVLLDVQLPDVDGFEVAERLAAGGSGAAIVLISSREAAAYGPRLEGAPATGFIAKRKLSGEALAALVR